jgi:hypothetical protein
MDARPRWARPFAPARTGLGPGGPHPAGPASRHQPPAGNGPVRPGGRSHTGRALPGRGPAAIRGAVPAAEAGDQRGADGRSCATADDIARAAAIPVPDRPAAASAARAAATSASSGPGPSNRRHRAATPSARKPLSADPDASAAVHSSSGSVDIRRPAGTRCPSYVGVTVRLALAATRSAAVRRPSAGEPRRRRGSAPGRPRPAPGTARRTRRSRPPRRAIEVRGRRARTTLRAGRR